jgi:hypothetical protein
VPRAQESSKTEKCVGGLLTARSNRVRAILACVSSPLLPLRRMAHFGVTLQCGGHGAPQGGAVEIATLRRQLGLSRSVDVGPDHYTRLEAVKMFTLLMRHAGKGRPYIQVPGPAAAGVNEPRGVPAANAAAASIPSELRAVPSGARYAAWGAV